MSYTIGSEMVTFSENAHPSIAGTTAERWFVKDGDRKVITGISSMADASARAAKLARDARKVRIALADGSTVRIPFGSAADFLGLDAFRNRVYRDSDVPSLVYAVTPCCQATGKGSGGSETGVVCRKCYRDVDSYFGGPAKIAIPRASEPRSRDISRSTVPEEYMGGDDGPWRVATGA